MTTFDVQFGARPDPPPNVERRPIREVPMEPIHPNAVGSAPVTDDAEQEEFDFWASVEAELEVEAIDSQTYAA